MSSDARSSTMSPKATAAMVAALQAELEGVRAEMAAKVVNRPGISGDSLR